MGKLYFAGFLFSWVKCTTKSAKKWNPTIIYDFTVVCITSVMRTILLCIRMEKATEPTRVAINQFTHAYDNWYENCFIDD